VGAALDLLVGEQGEEALEGRGCRTRSSLAYGRRATAWVRSPALGWSRLPDPSSPQKSKAQRSPAEHCGPVMRE
jgi:hypothetical protein